MGMLLWAIPHMRAYGFNSDCGIWMLGCPIVLLFMALCQPLCMRHSSWRYMYNVTGLLWLSFAVVGCGMLLESFGYVGSTALGKLQAIQASVSIIITGLLMFFLPRIT